MCLWSLRAATTMHYALWVHDNPPLGDNKVYYILFCSILFYSILHVLFTSYCCFFIIKSDDGAFKEVVMSTKSWKEEVRWHCYRETKSVTVLNNILFLGGGLGVLPFLNSHCIDVLNNEPTEYPSPNPCLQWPVNHKKYEGPLEQVFGSSVLGHCRNREVQRGGM